MYTLGKPGVGCAHYGAKASGCKIFRAKVTNGGFWLKVTVSLNVFFTASYQAVCHFKLFLRSETIYMLFELVRCLCLFYKNFFMLCLYDLSFVTSNSYSTD